MPWTDLTEQQQTFLRNYLQSSTWDFLFGAENSDVNKPTIAGFEEFERLDQEYLGLVLQIPADYPERTMIESSATAAYDQRDDGDFAEAGKLMALTVRDAKSTITTMTSATASLRTKAKPVIPGLTQTESDEIDTIHDRMMLRLVSTIPTRAEYQGAQADGLELDQAAQRITLAIAARKQARDDFDNAFKTVKPALERVSTFDIDPYRRTSKIARMKEVCWAAMTLLDEATLADTSVDPAVHIDLTTKLTEWNKTATVIDGIESSAKANIRNVLEGGYKDIKKKISVCLGIKISVYSTEDQSALQPVMQALTLSKKAIETALAGSDVTEQLRQYDGLKAVSSKLDEFDRLREVARDNREKVALGKKGVSTEQATAVTKLRLAAPDVLKSVNKTLDRSNKLLGNVEVTTQLIADRSKLRAEELKKYNTLEREIDDLKEQVKKIENDITEGIATKFAAEGNEADGLRERIEELDGDTSEAALKEVAAAQLRVEEIEKVLMAAMMEATEPMKSTVVAAGARVKEAMKERDTAADAYRAQNNFINAAETKKRLLDAVTYGPLALDRAKALDSDDLLRVTDLYAKNWELADHATTEIGRAQNPLSVIVAAETVSGRIKNSFGNKKWDEDTAMAYANNLVTMAGGLPEDMVDELETYLDNGAHKKTSPDMYRGKTYKEDVKNRTESVGKKMINDDGSLDIDSALDGALDVAFHPDSLKYPTPVLAAHMFETIEYFRNSFTAEDKIKAVTLPTDPGALALLSKGSGKTGAEITETTARQEVMNAMLTPVYQGDIASCFATAGVVKLRQTDPDRALDLYAQIVTEGTFTPRSPDPSRVCDPVPAVLNTPANENPIVRSLEFTIATAAALEEDSELSEEAAQSASAAARKMQDKIKPAEWTKVKAKIKAAIPAAFTFNYNSDVIITDSTDGSSEKGGYELISKATKKGISTEEDYVKAITPIVLAQIEASDMADTVTEATITDLVKSRDFLDAMKVGGQMPWELSSGGYSAEADKVIVGEDFVRESFITPDSPTEDPTTRPRRIMEKMLTALDGSTEEMAGLSVVGKHSFNALPQDPSLDRLKAGGPTKFAANLDRELIAKGTTLKNTAIPVERAAYMVEKQLRARAAKEKGAAKKALEDAILAHRPTTPLTPAELKSFIATATADYVTETAKQQANDWKEAEKKKNSDTDPADEEYNKKLAAITKSTNASVDEDALNVLITDLDVPQFKMADTNWGSAVDHTFFVMCPDPATGVPTIYNRKDPGGKLTPVTEDWLTEDWAQVH